MITKQLYSWDVSSNDPHLGLFGLITYAQTTQYRWVQEAGY
jgi:hypothetical protein